MMQAIGQALARLCIWIVGLPSVSLEARRAEAAKEARHNVTLAIGYRTGGDDEPDADDQAGESIDARGFGFAEYSEHDDEGDAEDRRPR